MFDKLIPPIFNSEQPAAGIADFVSREQLPTVLDAVDAISRSLRIEFGEPVVPPPALIEPTEAASDDTEVNTLPNQPVVIEAAAQAIDSVSSEDERLAKEKRSLLEDAHRRLREAQGEDAADVSEQDIAAAEATELSQQELIPEPTEIVLQDNVISLEDARNRVKQATEVTIYDRSKDIAA